MEKRGSYATEDLLLDAFRRGEALAAEQLVRRYANDLRRQAYNRLQNRADAEDVVQDLFADLWEKRQTLQIRETMEGYLHIALRNRILNHLARKKVRSDVTEHLLKRMDQMQTSILDILAEKELHHLLSTVVSDLPENMQRIFMLRGEDYSLKEIAQAMGLAEQTVKSYSAELSRRIRVAVAERYPDISRSTLTAIIYLFIKS